uniref:Uncharacterized protein n=1 Tax=Salix viminalis TaxID=40686 RepID=A0A6N2M427_SALVM
MELDECEETTLHDVNIEEEMRRKQQQAQEAYDEDDDMHGGGQRFAIYTCASFWIGHKSMNAALKSWLGLPPLPSFPLRDESSSSRPCN